jgi:hypothetical protein
MKLKVIEYNQLAGIGNHIIYALTCLKELKKKEIIYLKFNNFFYTNEINGNSWENFFYQPFQEYEDIIKKKIDRNDYTLIKSNSNKRIIGYGNNNIKNLYDKNFINFVRKIFKSFIKLKPSIINNANNFFLKNLKSKKNLSIHIRGTDKFKIHAQNQRSLFNYKDYIRPVLIDTIKINCSKKIFIATDELSKYKLMKKDFGKKLCKIKIKNLNETAIHLNNLYESENNKKSSCEEALTDTLLMSMCDYSLLSQSNLSLVSLLMRDDYNYKFIDEHIKYS